MERRRPFLSVYIHRAAFHICAAPVKCIRITAFLRPSAKICRCNLIRPFICSIERKPDFISVFKPVDHRSVIFLCNPDILLRIHHAGCVQDKLFRLNLFPLIVGNRQFIRILRRIAFPCRQIVFRLKRRHCRCFQNLFGSDAAVDICFEFRYGSLKSFPAFF